MPTRIETADPPYPSPLAPGAWSRAAALVAATAPAVAAVLAVAGVAAVSVARAGEVQSPSLCDQLAAKLNQSATPVADRSLARWIVGVKPEELNGPPSQLDAANASLLSALVDYSPQIAEGLGPIVEFSHLRGTSIYMGSITEGTAHCETSMFAEVGPDGTAHALPAPSGYTTPCWNLSGSLVTVLGQPSYVEAGVVTPTADDTLTRVTPWTSHGWGRACEVTVGLTYELKLRKTFCGAKQTVCRAAGTQATRIVEDYLAYRAEAAPSMRPIEASDQVPDFNPRDGATGDRGLAAVDDAWHVLAREAQARFPDTPLSYWTFAAEFPTFGSYELNAGWNDNFSYVNFALFPWVLEGRSYVGAVAHNGVGWREGTNTLIAVYEVPTPRRHGLVPVAGFAVERSPMGIKRIWVHDGVTARAGT